MPELNGIEALNLLKSIRPDTPVIIVTGTLDEETAVSCIKMGAWDYVLKDNLIHLGPVVMSALKRKKELEDKQKYQTALTESEERYREIVGRSLYEFISPEDIDSVRNDIQRTLNERKASDRERDKGELFSALTMSSRNRLWSRFSLTR